ncbi:MAG: hypothetical protein M0T82_16640 [Desulfobacteraceae bacterium]|nr:hypothetical protein [Desulfobacteraceae bacterium]
MAKFSEIIGGIAKDLAQVQMSADLASLEVLSHYKNNEILKNLDIPRFTLSDITMKLKFAIAAEIVPEQTEASVNYVDAEWLSILKKEVINDVLSSGQGLSVIEKKKIQSDFLRTSSSQRNPDLDIKNALAGSANITVDKSTNYIMEIYKTLPPETKKRLSAESSFETIVKDKVTAVFKARMPALKKVASAKASVERDLEIIIEKAALENINTEQIHEISLNLTPDFIKFVQDETAE